jgi:hypothetical protein
MPFSLQNWTTSVRVWNGWRSICGSALSSHRSRRRISAAHLVHCGHLAGDILEKLAHLADAERANADAPSDPVPARLDTRLPALLAHLTTANRPVHEVQVDVAEPARAKAALDRARHVRAPIIELELGRVEDRGARDTRGRAEVSDRAPALGLVFVPLGRVDVPVAGLCGFMDTATRMRGRHAPPRPRSRLGSIPRPQARTSLTRDQTRPGRAVVECIPKPRIGILFPSFS